MTFYDIDAGQARFDGSLSQVEAMQLGPEARRIIVRTPSELRQHAGWQAYLSASQYSMMQASAPEAWPNPVVTASTYGVGNDNPVDDYSMTLQQLGRSIMVEFENVNSFRWRYASTRTRACLEKDRCTCARVI